MLTPLLWTWLACGSPETGEPPVEAARPPRADGPNVLFVLWDTVRADRLSLYGHDRPTTPHLERWAAKGVIYERAISPGVWTLPSHASLFTGLAVSEHGVGDRRKWLDDDFVTLAERLRDAGWDTFAWSSNPFVSRKTNLLQGFDVVTHPWAPPWAHVAKRQLQRDRIAEASAGARSDDPDRWGMNGAGEVAVQALSAWLDGRERERPWFAFVNLMEAHTTRTPSLAARRRVMDEARVQASLALDQRNRRMQEVNAGVRTWTEDEVETVRAIYDATLVELDAITADLLAVVERRGELDDTVVVLVSDHGELLGEHGGMHGHQLAVWNELTRVPMVVVAPGRLAPGRVEEPTSTVELFGQLLRLTGVGGAEAITAAAEARRAHGVVTEYLEPMAVTLKALRRDAPHRDWSHLEQALVAIEAGPWKLVRGGRSGAALFDVTAGEVPAEAPAALEGMAARLRAWEATLRRFDHAGARPVKAPIDEDGGEKEGLRALGYVE